MTRPDGGSASQGADRRTQFAMRSVAEPSPQTSTSSSPTATVAGRRPAVKNGSPPAWYPHIAGLVRRGDAGHARRVLIDALDNSVARAGVRRSPHDPRHPDPRRPREPVSPPQQADRSGPDRRRGGRGRAYAAWRNRSAPAARVVASPSPGDPRRRRGVRAGRGRVTSSSPPGWQRAGSARTPGCGASTTDHRRDHGGILLAVRSSSRRGRGVTDVPRAVLGCAPGAVGGVDQRSKLAAEGHFARGSWDPRSRQYCHFGERRPRA